MGIAAKVLEAGFVMESVVRLLELDRIRSVRGVVGVGMSADA